MIRYHAIRQRAAAGDEGMAVVAAIGTVIILTSIALVLTSIFMYDTKPSVNKRETSQALTAARTGLTTTIAQIRGAMVVVNGEVSGDVTKLPCGTHSGSTSGTGGERDYVVTVRYFTTHPSQQNEAWRTTNALPCAEGTNMAETAQYALIEASGKVDPAKTKNSKTVEAVYTLSKFEPRSYGGLMRLTHLKQQQGEYTKPIVADACWEAKTATVGAAIVVGLCNNTIPPLQRWQYRKDLHIVLSESLNSDGTGGLCVDGTWTSPTSMKLTLQPCADVRTQKWFYNGTWTFTGLEQNADVLSGWCISTDPPARGGDYQTQVGDELSIGKFADNSGAWMCSDTPRTTPDKTVGAGNAGWTTRQLVNFGEYGRCMDIATAHVSAETVISYTCQARPNAATPYNQAFTWEGATSATKRITSDEGPTTYCLRGGQNVGDKAFFVSCTSLGAYGSWTIHGKQASPELAYAIQNDHNGLCLGLNPRAYSNNWSVLVSQNCDGSPEQRWNAEQESNTSTVNSYREVTS